MAKDIILGLESSCDETAAALVADGRQVLSSVVASQVDIHKKYGGVVPELAARAHIENIIPVVREAFDKAGVLPPQLAAVAAACSPGLVPALLIGLTCAKTFAWAWEKPFIGVNHVHSHLQSVMLDESAENFPAVALVVSGGHTSLYHCHSPLELTLLGRTLDDAAGEAFDKVAMILRLPYPGGPSIEKLAQKGNPHAIDFPRSLLEKGSLNFSFSGIKTAVLYYCHGKNMIGPDRVPLMTDAEKADIAAGFQAAVIDVLTTKTIWAVEQTKAKTVLLGGGVAANSLLREQLAEKCRQTGLKLCIAAKKFCTDNAAMIAGLAYYKLKAGLTDDLSLEAQPINHDSRTDTKRR